jgi:hypothetical protein
MVLFMRPTMATSPPKTYYRDNVKEDPAVDYAKEVLEVLKNWVLASLIQHSEGSIKKRKRGAPSNCGRSVPSYDRSTTTTTTSPTRHMTRRQRVEQAYSRTKRSNRPVALTGKGRAQSFTTSEASTTTVYKRLY